MFELLLVEHAGVCGFELRLVESINKSMAEVLAENGAIIIRYHIENRCSDSWENVIRSPQTFHKVLHEVFGIGAQVIEKHILHNLYSGLGLTTQSAWEAFTLFRVCGEDKTDMDIVFLKDKPDVRAEPDLRNFRG